MKKVQKKDFFMGKNVKRKVITLHNSTSWASHLCTEILEILTEFYLLKQRSPDYDDWLSNFRALKFKQLLHNDIILRLCKFREKKQQSVSFDQVMKEFKKKAPNKSRYQNLDKMIRKYRELTKNLVNHRISYIAHTLKNDKTNLKPTTEIFTAIRKAVEIADILCDEKPRYEIENIDLRVEVLGIT